MAENKKFYTQNPEKKTITVDYSVKPTQYEQMAVNTLLAAGYKLITKSQVRSAHAKDRAAEDKGLNKNSIREALKDKPELLKTFDEILEGKGEGKGFFAAKSWYKEKVLGISKKSKAKK